MRDAEMATAQAAAGAGEGEQNGGAAGHVDNGSGNKAGQHAVSFGRVKPQLVIQAPKAAEAIGFYKSAFGAEEVSKTLHAKRKVDQEQPHVLHAHLKFGDAEVLLVDEIEGNGTIVRSTATLNGTSFMLHLETPDVDAAFTRAIEAGATVSEEVSHRPSGQRCGMLVDPYGYVWFLATPPVSEETAVDIAEEIVEAGQAA